MMEIVYMYLPSGIKRNDFNCQCICHIFRWELSLFTPSAIQLYFQMIFFFLLQFLFMFPLRRAYHFSLLLYNAVLKISTIRLCVSNRKYCWTFWNAIKICYTPASSGMIRQAGMLVSGDFWQVCSWYTFLGQMVSR